SQVLGRVQGALAASFFHLQSTSTAFGGTKHGLRPVEFVEHRPTDCKRGLIRARLETERARHARAVHIDCMHLELRDQSEEGRSHGRTAERFQMTRHMVAKEKR